MRNDPRRTSLSPELARSLQQALHLHRQGALRDAERLYLAVLAANPRQIEALHMLGTLRLQQGRAADALPVIDAALQQRPDHADLLLMAVAALFQLGRHQDALPRLDRLVALRPTDADVHFNRGVVWAALGRSEQALASYRAAIGIQPGHPQALFNTGTLLASLGHFGDARDMLDRLLAKTPDHADALDNRGNVLVKLGRNEDAVADYSRALALKPDSVRTLTNRASALKTLGRSDEALADYQHALRLDPGNADTLFNRGNLMIDLRRPAEADADFERALALRPDDSDIHIGRAAALLHLRRPDEAIAHYRKALALKPDQPAFHSDLIFVLNFDPSVTVAEQQAERTRWYERHARPFAEAATPHANSRDPERRLRIGYVSSHFCQQAATYAFGGLIDRHDESAFEVICYSDTKKEDEVTGRLRASAERWHRINDLPDERVAEMIRSDSIDILVDLVGHMQGSHLFVFARRPAPIQVTGWGEPTGTGLRTMDYLFADPVLVPPADRPLYTETIFDLPSTLSYWSPVEPPEPASLPALSQGHVTFGSFNRLAKVIDPVLRTWAAILRAVPNSRLVLKDRRLASDSQETPILGTLAEEGIDTGRVTFLDQSDRDGHFAAFRQVDIALDPFPHSGGMTTLDALWMGVPVVTNPGTTPSSRLAASCLTAVGLTDFIAPDLQSYINLAIAKANDLAALNTLRTGLRAQMAATPLGSPDLYARAVEAAYRQMWQRWCAAAR